MVDFWTEDHQKGVVFYRRQERIQGAVFWNEWEKLDACRTLMAEVPPHRNDRLQAWVEANTDIR